MEKKFIISREYIDGVIFDLDGVITQSAKIHAKAWKKTFDEFLRGRSSPFNIRKDYDLYVDGKPRYEGVKSFLTSRKISLPLGSPEDTPDRKTIYGIGNHKNELFLKYLSEEGVEVYESSLDLAKTLRRLHFKLAVVTSSKNGSRILDAARIPHLFDIQADGHILEKMNLKGKPHPDIFLWAAEKMKVSPKRTVIIEDALSGIEAGVAGHFGQVIAVCRTDQDISFQKAGANVIVTDLNEIGAK